MRSTFWFSVDSTLSIWDTEKKVETQRKGKVCIFFSCLTDLCMEMGFWFLQWGRPCSSGTSCAYFSRPSPATSWRPDWEPLPVLPSFRTTWSWPLGLLLDPSMSPLSISTIFKTTLWSFWADDERPEAEGGSSWCARAILLQGQTFPFRWGCQIAQMLLLQLTLPHTEIK